MKIREIVDVIAVPFFFLLSLYFYSLENKTPIEYTLYIFSITGFIVDLSLTLLLVKSQCRKVCKSGRCIYDCSKL